MINNPMPTRGECIVVVLARLLCVGAAMGKIRVVVDASEAEDRLYILAGELTRELTRGRYLAGNSLNTWQSWREVC